MKHYSNIDATVVIVDLRNFTNTYEKYQKSNIDILLNYMDDYYKKGIQIADISSLSNDYFISSTGDGLLVIFMGKGHERSGYIFSLVFYQLANKMCEDFNMANNEKISFGIGIETGVVQEIVTKNKGKSIETYLGSVINSAARIETISKQYNRTKLVVGNRIYNKLSQELFPEEYKAIVEDAKHQRRDHSLSIKYHNEINQLNQKLMLFYIFEHNLKGVEFPVPLYRLSPTLADINKNTYYEVLQRLCDSKEKFDEVKSYLVERLFYR